MTKQVNVKKDDKKDFIIKFIKKTYLIKCRFVSGGADLPSIEETINIQTL